MESPPSTSDQLLIIYDGDCPFCARYADLADLRARGLSVCLKNARDADLYATWPDAAGYDLDRGMLVRWRGQWFEGAAAMATISALVRGAPLATAFRHGWLATLMYPLLRFGRGLVLRARGVKPIGRARTRL